MVHSLQGLSEPLVGHPVVRVHFSDHVFYVFIENVVSFGQVHKSEASFEEDGNSSEFGEGGEEGHDVEGENLHIVVWVKQDSVNHFLAWLPVLRSLSLAVVCHVKVIWVAQAH